MDDLKHSEADVLLASSQFNNQKIYNIILFPKWIKIWIIISALIVFWDVMFVLLRPASLPEGSLAFIWIPYAKYIQIDISYADMQNNFVITQAIMSLFEICIGIISLYLAHIKKTILAILFAFSALLLTGTKTIFIFLQEFIGHFEHVNHNSISDLVFSYILPNSVWIIIPFIAVFCLGKSLTIYTPSNR